MQGLGEVDKGAIREMCRQLLDFQNQKRQLVATWTDDDPARKILESHKAWQFLEHARTRAALEELAM